MGDDDQSITRYEWERVMRRARVGAMTKYVGMVLAQYANTDGTSAYPSVDKLARVCEVSDRTVRNALRELCSRGLLVRRKRGGMHGREAYSSVYDLAIPADFLEWDDALPGDEGPVPNGNVVPVGESPNGNLTTPQVERGSSQVESDDAQWEPATTYLTQDQPNYLPEDQRDHSVEDVTTRGQCATCDKHGDFPICCVDHLFRLCPACLALHPRVAQEASA